MRINLHQKTATRPQLEFWNNTAKYRAFIGGIGSGKTKAGSIECLRQPSGSIGCVLAPTYGMLKISTYEEIVTTAENAGIVKELHKADMRLDLLNGSRIYFRTADNPERLRGVNLGWFWLEAAGMMSEDVWYIMQGRLRLGPSKAWLTTTPKGFNWHNDVFVRDKNPDCSLIKSRTHDNKYLPTDFIKSVEGSYSTEFARQELEGEFIDDASNMIKKEWWKYYKQLPNYKRLIWSWDTAFEKNTASDYSVGSLWADCADGYYLIDIIRGKYEFPELKRTVINAWNKNKSSVILIEKKASGHSLIQELRRFTSLPIKEVKVDKDKIARTHAVNGYIESGRVKLPENAPWLHDFIYECSMFPSPRTNDDQVDSMTQALNYMLAAGAYQIGFI